MNGSVLQTTECRKAPKADEWVAVGVETCGSQSESSSSWRDVCNGEVKWSHWDPMAVGEEVKL